uniref:Endo/exonuclease/phosphatase domain-containing protein n=1 Tax=Rhodnius prolixus TaxID=13249 RepID=T1HXG9_RHOPR
MFANYNECKIIIAGDLNARISNLNSFYDDIFMNSSFHGIRYTLDTVINSQGNRIIEIMEDFGMLICNGRSNADRRASYTYISRNGCSVIDHIWINSLFLDSQLDFEVLKIPEISDHLPVLLN